MSKIAFALRISKQTVNRLKLNFLIIILVKIILVSICYFIGINAILLVIGDIILTLTTIFSSLMLMKKKYKLI